MTIEDMLKGLGESEIVSSPYNEVESYNCEGAYEDALDHATSIEDLKSDLTVYWKCPGCDFPHKSEQQAINCCTPTQVFECPQCFSFRYSEHEARECCR